MTGQIQDVPSPIDFRNSADAREWADTAMAKRPWRSEFFARITEELSNVGGIPLSILELGSGPGFLAQYLLAAFPMATYTALDFSRAMHAIAKERLGLLSDRVTFTESDFRVPGWARTLAPADAVVTMQAVHELRHKRHASDFYQAIRPLVRPSGVLMMCDHFSGQGGMNDENLFMTPEEHEAAIREGGFSAVDLIMRKGGLVLFRASATKLTPSPPLIPNP